MVIDLVRMGSVVGLGVRDWIRFKEVCLAVDAMAQKASNAVVEAKDKVLQCLDAVIGEFKTITHAIEGGIEEPIDHAMQALGAKIKTLFAHKPKPAANDPDKDQATTARRKLGA